MTPPKKKRGPKPQTLKVEGEWTAAVARMLKAGKPPTAKKKRKRRAAVRA
ncbi:MAG: hypothetical protein ACKVU4_12285 [Phycisphaerales bacterium]